MHVIPAQIAASDGFAIAMLGVILLSMGMIGVLFWCMKRNAARRDPHVDSLLEELEDDERRERLSRTAPVDEKSREPWERESDWWKS